MLTSQHYNLCKINNQSERESYRIHMCSLCHALGDEYGLPYRLLVHQDVLLLSLLTEAQSQTVNQVIARRCPLNPFQKVSAYRNDASAFVAAVAVALFRISQADHWKDSKNRNLVAFILLRALESQYEKAQAILETMGFDNDHLNNLLPLQLESELAPSSDVAAPSAKISAALFAMTSVMANSPHNAPALTRIGAAYGEYVYLKDALDDFVEDCLRDEFNPLKKFSRQTNNEVRLERRGVLYLLERLKAIEKIIREELSRVQFTKNNSLIHRLLLEPIGITTELLQKRLNTMREELVFMKLRSAEIAKALVLAMPLPIIFASSSILPDPSHFALGDHMVSFQSNPCNEINNLCTACQDCLTCLECYASNRQGCLTCVECCASTQS